MGQYFLDIQFFQSVEICIDIVLTFKMTTVELLFILISGTASALRKHSLLGEASLKSRWSGSANCPTVKWCSQTRKFDIELIPPV